MKILIASVALWSAAAAMTVSAQSLPETENGRFALSAIPDGIVRLDTRNGAVSTCTDKGNGWACTIVPDERAAFDAEIGRLQKENKNLQAQFAERGPNIADKTDESMPKQDSLKPKAEAERKIEIPRIEIPLPSERDVDRAMAFVESAWRRLIDIANRLQRDNSSGKI